ncbi:recombinase family protein [Bradyrhizobium japonicum]
MAAKAAKKADADRFASNILPNIEAVRKAGAKTLREIADALNARGIHTANGGNWYPTTVKNILDRSLTVG